MKDKSTLNKAWYRLVRLYFQFNSYFRRDCNLAASIFYKK